jgi:hypothetical protein
MLGGRKESKTHSINDNASLVDVRGAMAVGGGSAGRGRRRNRTEERWRSPGRAHIRNRNVSSTELDAIEFCGLPLIGQKRPMNGAQLHPSRVGNAGGGLLQGLWEMSFSEAR